MRILTDYDNSSQYITYREGNRNINGVDQTCLHLTLHDNKISKDNKKNAIAKATISYQEFLDYIIKGD